MFNVADSADRTVGAASVLETLCAAGKTCVHFAEPWQSLQYYSCLCCSIGVHALL